MPRHRLAFLAALVAAVPGSAWAQESFTTRIEPRAYYGATVSIEQGVRVWRPLPPIRQMIINPDHGTPLSLSFTDVRETRNNNTYDYHYDRGDNAYGYGGGIGFPDGVRHKNRPPREGGFPQRVAPRN
jgi:hypothetical protein